MNDASGLQFLQCGSIEGMRLDFLESISDKIPENMRYEISLNN